MKERPLYFSAPMVRAILEGRKTMTRRIMKEQPRTKVISGSMGHWSVDPDIREYKCPYAEIGDHLWVRETWAAPHEFDGFSPRFIPQETRIHYAATALLGATDGVPSLGGLMKRFPIFMPRWASRITLEITDVRAERLQKITEDDAVAEGVTSDCPIGYYPAYKESPHVYCFAQLWDSINGAGSWTTNPFVWVISFRRI